MADLEAVLADVSYLMAMEKSKVQGGNTGGIGKKKIVLPGVSVRSVIIKTLKARNKLSFERLIHQRMGYELLLEFCCPESASLEDKATERYTLFSFYREIVSYEKTFDEEKRDSMAQVIYDKYVMPDLLSREETELEPIHEKVSERLRNENLPLDLFEPFKARLELKLKDVVWNDFLKSQQFLLFCQWKYVQLTQKVTIEHFMIHRIIGRGGFGEVFGCCKSDTGQMFALKCLCKKRLKTRHHEGSAVHERNMLAKVHSPFIVCLSYAFQTSERLFLAVDLCNGGDLHYHLTQHGSFSEEMIRFYIAEIALGLDHLHSRKIVYRDLKPSNILLTDAGHCKISDLGLAVSFERHRVRDAVGTHGYMAPELIKKEHYTFTPDWFSFGCMLVRLSSSHGAFSHGTSAKKEIDNNCVCKDPYLPPDASSEYLDLINALLVKDPLKRLCCCGSGIRELRHHPFMKAVSWGKAMSVELTPPIVPPSDVVNAAEVNSIGQFNEDEVKAIKLSEEDQKHYRYFDCIVSDRWQNEVCDSVFKTQSAEALKVYTRRLAKLKSKVYDPGHVDSGTDCLLDGHLYRQTSVIHTWKKNYFYLFPNRLEWSEDHLHFPTGLVLVDTFRTVNESTVKSQRVLRLRYVEKSETKELVLKADTEMELDLWHAELKVALSRSEDVLKGASHKVKSAQSNSAIGDNTSTAIASAAAATGAGGGLSDMRTLRKALSTSGFTLAFTAPITGVSPTMAPPSVSDLVAASAPPDHDSMMMGDDNVILDS